MQAINLEPMVFESAQLLEVPVTVEGENFILQEAPEATCIRFRNMAMKTTKMRDGKIVGIEGAADVQAFLVSCCLHPVDSETGKMRVGSDGEPVPTDIRKIKRWSGKIVKALFERAKAISGLDERSKKVPKTREEIEKAIADLQAQLATMDAVDPNI